MRNGLGVALIADAIQVGVVKSCRRITKVEVNPPAQWHSP